MTRTTSPALATLRGATVVAMGLVIGLAACARPLSGGSPTSGPTTIPLTNDEHRAGQALLDRWADAVVKVGGPPWFSVNAEAQTGLIGEWESGEIGENGKIALYAGAVQAVPALSDAAPPSAEVRWADGLTRTMPVLSPADSLAALQANGNKQCGTCQPLVVTGAKLSTVEVPTSRGQATVPAWEFTLQGTSVQITQVAVSPSAAPEIVPLAGPGRGLESASGARDSLVLTVSFVGSPGTGDQMCGADYDGAAIESPYAVVVFVHEHPNTATMPPNTGCAAMGARRSVTVQLAAPLGDRAVLDPSQGVPITVTFGS